MGKAAQRKRNKNSFDERDIALLVESNKPTEYMYQMLQLFYRGAYSNTIGLMEALHVPSGETHLLIVGLQLNADGSVADVHPLAKAFGMGESDDYKAPDGRGNWLDKPSAEEVSERYKYLKEGPVSE